MEVGEMWCRLVSKYVLKVKVSEATHACRDDKLYAGLKAVIDGEVNKAN